MPGNMTAVWSSDRQMLWSLSVILTVVKQKHIELCVVVTAEIGKCVLLNSLYLQHNELTVIPESVGNLRLLTRLGLRYSVFPKSLLFLLIKIHNGFTFLVTAYQCYPGKKAVKLLFVWSVAMFKHGLLAWHEVHASQSAFCNLHDVSQAYSSSNVGWQSWPFLVSH